MTFLALPQLMRDFWKGGVAGGPCKQRFVGKRGKSDGTESETCGAKEVPAVEGGVDSFTGHRISVGKEIRWR